MEEIINKKIFAKILVKTIALLLIFFLILSIKYSPVYVYRLVTIHFADAYNDHYLENRISKGNENEHKLKKKPDSAFVDSIFVNRVLQSGLDNFNNWAEKAKTATRVFVRKDSVFYEKYFDRFIKNVHETMLRLKR